MKLILSDIIIVVPFDTQGQNSPIYCQLTFEMCKTFLPVVTPKGSGPNLKLNYQVIIYPKTIIYEDKRWKAANKKPINRDSKTALSKHQDFETASSKFKTARPFFASPFFRAFSHLLKLQFTAMVTYSFHTENSWTKTRLRDPWKSTKILRDPKFFWKTIHHPMLGLPVDMRWKATQ